MIRAQDNITTLEEKIKTEAAEQAAEFKVKNRISALKFIKFYIKENNRSESVVFHLMECRSYAKAREEGEQIRD